MAEKLAAGVILIALGLVGTWHFAPALFGVLGSLMLVALGVWLVLGAMLDRT